MLVALLVIGGIVYLLLGLFFWSYWQHFLHLRWNHPTPRIAPSGYSYSDGCTGGCYWAATFLGILWPLSFPIFVGIRVISAMVVGLLGATYRMGEKAGTNAVKAP